MDARALIETVAETYRGLETLAVDLVITEDSDDEGGSMHRVQRAKAFFATPDKVRIEDGGRRGNITVADGGDVYQYHPHPKRYSKHPLQADRFLPGLFRTDLVLLSNQPFLFGRIAERIADAEILREEFLDGESTPCLVLRVTYDPPDHAGRLWTWSPVLFWIDSRTHLVSKLEGDVTVQHPGREEAKTSRWSLRFENVVVNRPIAAETFELVAPPDAMDISDPKNRSNVSGGGGGGSVQFRGGQQFQTSHSHQWAGDTLVGQMRYKMWGFEIVFERRLSLSDDRSEVLVVERVIGPKGQTEREFSVPVA
jgi:outer membrane lipoprotein-sorting protein